MKKGFKNLLLLMVLGIVFIIPNKVNASNTSFYDNKNTNFDESSYEINRFCKSYDTTKDVMNFFLLFLEGTLIYYAFKKEEKGLYK